VPWQFLQFSDLSSSLQYWAQHTPFVSAQLVSLQEFAGTSGRAAERLRPGSSETAGPRHARVAPPVPPLPVEPAPPPVPVCPPFALPVEPAIPPVPVWPPPALPAEPEVPPSDVEPDAPPDEAEPPLPADVLPPEPPVAELPDPFEHAQAASRQTRRYFLSDSMPLLWHR
jgi:hypothetical protein